MAFYWKWLLLSLSTVILLSGFLACGYGFRAKGEPIGISIESLAIPLFESKSTDRGFEAEFTEIIRNEFISRSKIPIVEMARARAVITGVINEIEIEPLSYNTIRQTVEGNTVAYETGGTRKLIVRLNISLMDSVTGELIWHDDSMEEETSFNVSEDPLQNRFNKDQAIRNIAGLMAKRIYLNTMERF
jgi:hypothetical protein